MGLLVPVRYNAWKLLFAVSAAVFGCFGCGLFPLQSSLPVPWRCNEVRCSRSVVTSVNWLSSALVASFSASSLWFEAVSLALSADVLALSAADWASFAFSR